jgi:carbonic anhydrase/acetyltransferase-like protein (isoleucine patch superfamily)
VFLGRGAIVAGDVIIGEGSSIWFNAVIRGDEGQVIIGKNVNVQDCCVIHSDRGWPVEIGDEVTIGHGAVVRSAQLESGVMIGMQSTVLTGAKIGDNSLVGAHSLITGNFTCPPRSLVWGTPAKVIRTLSEDEIKEMGLALEIYGDLRVVYASGKVELIFSKK